MEAQVCFDGQLPSMFLRPRVRYPACRRKDGEEEEQSVVPALMGDIVVTVANHQRKLSGGKSY